MGSHSQSYVSSAALCCVVFMLLLSSAIPCKAKLSSAYYDHTCPNALSAIQTAVKNAVSLDPTAAAPLVRLHFHDCFVQGCDGSILLNDSATIKSEKNASPNMNSVGGFDVIDTAKSAVEKICPGVVSCADIVAVAARDAAVAVGGPSWIVKLGRRDSTTANPAEAEADLPKFSDSLNTLIYRFAKKGLNAKDMVVLSGAHTIGQAHCAKFRDRIYSNSTNIDKGFANLRRRDCPIKGGDNNVTDLDVMTPNTFDNNYYKDIIQNKGLLASDQVLFSGGKTDKIVLHYSKNPSKFGHDFGSAMVKMGNFRVLTGRNGEIRRICSAVN